MFKPQPPRATAIPMQRVQPRSMGRKRRGVILSAELLFVLPVIFGLLLAIVQFSLLWHAQHKLKAASISACRVASHPVADTDEFRLEVSKAAEDVLEHPRWITQYKLKLERGETTGSPVSVEIGLPMGAAAPNLLAFLGVDVNSSNLVARTVMRRE